MIKTFLNYIAYLSSVCLDSVTWFVIAASSRIPTIRETTNVLTLSSILGEILSPMPCNSYLCRVIEY